jgi:hypothetical protein
MSLSLNLVSDIYFAPPKPVTNWLIQISPPCFGMFSTTVVPKNPQADLIAERKMKACVSKTTLKINKRMCA